MSLTGLLGGAAFAQQGDDVVTKQYDDGGVYEGTFRNGLQHGTGTYRLPNGYEYTGDWVEGEIRGEGVARFPNGSVYEGQFAKGKPEGSGKIIFADGGTYEGTGSTARSPDRASRSTPTACATRAAFRNALHHGTRHHDLARRATSTKATGSTASRKATAPSPIPTARSTRAVSPAALARAKAS